MKSNGLDGFLFLFNPNSAPESRKIVLDGYLKLKPPSDDESWLLSGIYSKQRYLQLIEYGQTVELRLDIQNATVFKIRCTSNISEPAVI